jgi:hypothetical protein
MCGRRIWGFETAGVIQTIVVFSERQDAEKQHAFNLRGGSFRNPDRDGVDGRQPIIHGVPFAGRSWSSKG